MARTGRRRGNPDTREAILAAARDVFSQHGFDGASVRAIATSAGVDPALVHHYFGTKEKLFLATVDAPMDPATFFPRILAGDVDALGARLVGAFLNFWDDPVTGPAALALLRSALRQDWSARILREFLTSQILRRLMAALPVEQANLRASLVASQMFGLAGARYLLNIEPLASAAHDVVVAAIGPTIQRYLTGTDLGPGINRPGGPVAQPPAGPMSAAGPGNAASRE